MKALVFGASGQDGYYLSQLCKQKGITVVACSRSPGDWTQADVSCYSQVEALVQQHEPDYVFHLAANSTTRHDGLFENHETIATGTLNILEAARLRAPQSRIFLPGSGVQFKNTGQPISEWDEFEASSAYSVSRIHSVYAGRYYRSLGLKVYVGYLFHHESPLRRPSHVSKVIALAARRIAQGSNEVIELGDISVEKEWTFAGDVVEGIFTLVNQDRVFEAAIGSGVAYSITDWLEECFSGIGREWRPYVHVREGFVPEYRRLVSDPTTIRELGWQPVLAFKELASLMMQAP